ncbi:hypothetical protein NL676_038674 [Syzygium grande]|nr:hypothetical protein NL676_038674 [Syzygium grande]
MLNELARGRRWQRQTIFGSCGTAAAHHGRATNVGDGSNFGGCWRCGGEVCQTSTSGWLTAKDDCSSLEGIAARTRWKISVEYR